MSADCGRGRTGGRRVEAPPWLSLFFSPFPPLTPLLPPNLSPPHGTGKIGARDQGRYGTARNGRCVTRRPFPSTLTPFYQIRGNRNFARSLDVVDTHRHRYSMTRHCVCVCVYPCVYPCKDRGYVITKERASTRWKDEAVIYRNIVSVPFRGASSIRQRIDIARRRIPPRSFSHHPRRVSFFLSLSLSSSPFISSIRVVASIRSSSGV